MEKQEKLPVKDRTKTFFSFKNITTVLLVFVILFAGLFAVNNLWKASTANDAVHTSKMQGRSKTTPVLSAINYSENKKTDQSKSLFINKDQKKKQITEALAKSPSEFTKNMGQWDDKVLYKGGVLGLNVSYLKNGLSYGFATEKAGKHEQLVWNQYFEGISEKVQVTGEEGVERSVNYIIGLGGGTNKTLSNVPIFRELYYRNVYNNIDVRYYARPASPAASLRQPMERGQIENSSSPNQMETDYILKAGSNINDIRVRFDGIKNLVVDRKGVLLVNTDLGALREYIPSSYQVIDGEKREVPVKYKLINDNTYGFEVCGIYDRSKELVIDPVILQWATFVGGVQPVPHYIFGSIVDIECDSLGFIYGTGWNSDGFPTTPGAYQVPNAGQADVVVFKMNPAATALVWATYVGTTDGGAATNNAAQVIGDWGRGIDFDASGVYVTGSTDRNTFPTTPGAFQTTYTGATDAAFALKLNTTGTALIYSTLLGSNSRGQSVDVLPSGEVILGGFTGAGFPSTPGAFQPASGGGIDGYITKLNTTGTALVYSTYVGGSANDSVYKVAVDKSGNTYACGTTGSANFPTVGPYQAAISGTADAFLFKINAAGSALTYSTYFGGSAFECGLGVAVNSAGQAYICGGTRSANMPVLAAFQATIKVGLPFDAFVTKFNAAGNGLIYSTFLGGTDNDWAWDIDVSCTDEAYVNGWTAYGVNGSPKTTGFPSTTCGFTELPAWGGNVMVGSFPPCSFFICKFSPAGALVYASTKLGCSKQTAIALVEYNCCVRGAISGSGVWHQISQLEFKTTPGVFQQTDPRWTKVDIAVLWRITPKAGMTLAQTTTTCAAMPKFTITFADACWGTPTLTWNFGDGTTGTGTSVTHEYKQTGTYTVKVIADCPKDSLTKTVTINSPPCSPTITATGTSICGGGCANITATAAGGSAPYTYSWSSGATGLTANVCPTVTTTYTVTLTDNTANTNTSTALVTVNAGTTLTTTKTDVNCPGGTTGVVTVSGSGGTAPYSYLWSSGSTAATVSNLAPATYTVTSTDAKGCTQTATAVVGQPAPIVLTPGTGTTNCGTSNGTVVIAGSGGTGTLTYLWNTGATGLTITNAAAGSYTVTATDSKSCTQSAVVTINNSPSPTINTLTGVPLQCNGYSNGSATVTASGGTGTLTYNWSNGASGVTSITGLAANTYVVSVKDANGCIAVSTVSITEPPAIVTSTNPVSSTCGNANGSANVTVTGGGTGPFTFSWSNGATGQTISGLIAAPYTVTVQDANGCTKTTTVTVNNIGGGVVTASTQSNVKCNGAGDGSVTATVVGGSIPYNFVWSNGFTGQTITNLAPGTYTVTLTDISGCISTGTAAVTEPPAITATPASSPASCGASNGSVSVAAGGGGGSYTYLWNTSATAQTVAGLAAGSYTVTVSDAGNCSVTTVAIVSNSGTGTVTTAVQTNVTCNGGSDGSAVAIISGGTPGYNYSWSNGASSSTLSGVSQGTYSVTVTDASSCKVISTVVITEPAAIISNTASLPTTCGLANGTASVTASGGTGVLNYSWSSGAVGQTAVNLASATYTVTITDASNCVKTAVVAVSSDPAPSINGMNASSLLCAGNSDGSVTVSVSGGTGALTYSWSNGSSGVTAITGLTAGIYGVSITDASGCTAISTVSITEPPVLNVPAITTTNASCGVSDGSATASSSGGTPSLIYSWSTGSVGAVANNLSAGSYTVTVTDANGCIKTGVAIVSNTGGPSVTSVTPADILCNGGNTGTVVVVIAGGTGPYSYNWSNGVTLITSNTQSDINNLLAASYTVTVKDAMNCQVITSVTLTEPPAIGITFVTNNAACNQSDGSAIATVTGGTGILTYSWSTGDTSPSASNLAAATYSLTVTDGNGCIQTSAASVLNIGAPSSSASVLTGVPCNGGSGSLEVSVSGGTGPYTYSWSNGIGSSTTGLQSVISGTAATYTVTVTDSKNCITISTVTLTEPALLAITSTSQPAQCGNNDGSVYSLASGGSGGYIFNWSPPAGPGQAFGNLAPGTYTVTVTDVNGCSATSSATVGDTTFVIATSTPVKQTIAEGGFVTINVSGGVTYTWSPAPGLSCTNCPNLIASPAVTTTYTVMATDAGGCTAIAMFTIIVKPPCIGDDANMYVANVFSPNNDGKNDVLYVQGNGITNIYWAIYDRWGNLLFEAFDQNHGWDGTRKGNPMDSGVYVYYLKATCIANNSEVKLKGNVSIVK